MKRVYAIFVILLLISSSYPQIVGISQAVNNKTEYIKSQQKIIVNPKDKLADEIQAENRLLRQKALASEEAVIKDIKNSVRVKVVYRTIYKKTIDTVFIPVMEVDYNQSDSNNYFINNKPCVTETIYIKKKGILQRLFGN